MKYQVNYLDRDGWQDVEDEARMKRILADNVLDLALLLKEMQRGQTARTTFALYRVNPTHFD